MLEGNLQTRLFSSKVRAFLQAFYPDNPEQFQSAFNGEAGGLLSVSAALVDPHPVLYMLPMPGDKLILEREYNLIKSGVCRAAAWRQDFHPAAAWKASNSDAARALSPLL